MSTLSKIMLIILICISFKAYSDDRKEDIITDLYSIANVNIEDLPVYYVIEQSGPALGWVNETGIYLVPEIWEGGDLRFAHVLAHELGHWVLHFGDREDIKFPEDEADYAAAFFCEQLEGIFPADIEAYFDQYVESVQEEYGYLNKYLRSEDGH